MNPIEVECIYCGRPDGHPCALKNGQDSTLFHLQRKLLWILRQENAWAQLLSFREEGYAEEQARLHAKLRDMQIKSVNEAPQTLERSLVEEIQSTRDGRAALRFASENCDLRELLDLANKLITFAQEMADITCGQDDDWMSDFRKFSDLYKQDLEKRK